MSWQNDRLLSEALAAFTPVGGHVADQKMMVYGKHLMGANEAYNIIAVATPMNPTASMCMATSCSFETSQVWDVYLQYTLHASSVTYTDYLYWGRLNAETNTQDHSPPTAYLYSVTGFSLTGIDGQWHVITKQGWNMGGVLYDSSRVAGRF